MSVTYPPLQLWNKRWKLDGPWVGCRRCGYVQHVTNPRAFYHPLGCPAQRLHGQYRGVIVEQRIQDGLF